jgi:hypothetical protein
LSPIQIRQKLEIWHLILSSPWPLKESSVSLKRQRNKLKAKDKNGINFINGWRTIIIKCSHICWKDIIKDSIVLLIRYHLIYCKGRRNPLELEEF